MSRYRVTTVYAAGGEDVDTIEAANPTELLKQIIDDVAPMGELQSLTVILIQENGR